MGKFLRWLINDQNGTFFGMKLPTGFQLIGQTTLQQYRAWLDYFDRQSKLENTSFVTRTTKRAYARIGVSALLINLSLFFEKFEHSLINDFSHLASTKNKSRMFSLHLFRRKIVEVLRNSSYLSW